MRSFSVLALCLLELACNPGFGLDSFGSSRLAVGARCSSSAECASGVCSEHVCCKETCDATSTCALAGKEGDCTPRPIGASCSDSARCANAADGSAVPCVDGVCCASACDGLCQSCAVPGHEGQCRDAPDNTDARGQCDKCWACYSGACAPATVGTDPKGACAAEGAAQGLELTCSAKQACAPKLGSACATTADCALGECIGDRCLLGEVESVFVFPMRQASTGRYLGGMAVDSSGALSILFTEEQIIRAESSVSVVDHSLGIATRSAEGFWSGRRFLTDKMGYERPIPAAITALGRWRYVVSYSQSVSLAEDDGTGHCKPAPPPSGKSIDPTVVPCGVFGRLIGPDGESGDFEVISPKAYSWVGWIGLITLSSGDLALGYHTGKELHLRIRSSATNGWGDEILVAKTSDPDGSFWYPRLLKIGDGGVFVFNDHWSTQIEGLHLNAVPFDATGALGSASKMPAIAASNACSPACGADSYCDDSESPPICASGTAELSCDARGLEAAPVADQQGDGVLAAFQCRPYGSGLVHTATWRPSTGWSAPERPPASAKFSNLWPTPVPFPSSSWPWIFGGNWPMWSNMGFVGLSWKKSDSSEYDSAGGFTLVSDAVTMSELVTGRSPADEPIMAGVPIWYFSDGMPPLTPELLVYRYHR